MASTLNGIYNGVFAIEQIVSPIQLTYRLYSDPGADPDAPNGATIGGILSSEPIAIRDEPPMIRGITYNGDGTATITTSRPHQRTTWHNALLNAIWQVDGSGGISLSPFTDTFAITAIVSPTQFKIVKPEGVPIDPADLRFFEFGEKASLGPHFLGRGGIGGTGCVTEGNAYYDCIWGCYQDTGSSRDITLRDNYYSNIGIGTYMNFEPAAFDAPGTTSAIVPDLDASDPGWKHGVFTTIQPHNLICIFIRF